MRKIVTLFNFVVLMSVMTSCTDPAVDRKPDEDGKTPEDFEDIEEVDGKVRFYISVDDKAPSIAMGAKRHEFSTRDVIHVNNSVCNVKVDDRERFYIEVKAASNKIYRAGFYEDDKYFSSSCFSGVRMVYAQYYKEGGYPLEYPMYAVYSKNTGNKLIFKDGYAAVAIKLKGSADISSIKLEDPAGGRFGGTYDFDTGKGALVATGEDMIGFAVLNCGADGDGVGLEPAGKTFYIAVPARDYPSGIEVTVCDRNHLAVFHKIPAGAVEPNSIKEVTLDYAPASGLCFYEGFDTFVWGGDPMAAKGSAAYLPDDGRVDIEYGTRLTGYEEPLVPAAYDTPGSGYIQPDAWNSRADVSENHQMSASYVKSRNLYDWRNLYRCQEYRGFLAIGAAATTRGLMQTPAFRRIGMAGTVEVSFKLALKAGFNDRMLLQVVNGGEIVACELNGTLLTLDDDNLKYEGNASTLVVSPSQMEAGQWNRVKLTVGNAGNGTALCLAAETTTAGIHGSYVDDISVVKVADTHIEPGPGNMRVMFYNILNGMWSDQGNNYDNFVEWVKGYDPDVCVFAEAQTNYYPGTDTRLPAEERILPDGWGELAARFGHNYWVKGGHINNFPQVITSKYPLTRLQEITDNGPRGLTVSHGACHAKITVQGEDIHIVSLHMWARGYAMGVNAAGQAADEAAHGGDYYREKEIVEILDMTVNNPLYSGVGNWIVAGDTNSRSPVDNRYYNYAEDDTRMLVHKYIRANTPLKDVIGERYPGKFYSSTGGNVRIDFMYVSPDMYDRITGARIVMDAWCSPKPDPVIDFSHPSDHRPVLADFNMEL